MRAISLALIVSLAGAGCTAEARPDETADPAVQATQVAQATPAAGEACDIDAFVERPEGLEVRATPDLSAPVVGTIPGPRHDALNERDWMPSVHLAEGRDGWLRIDRAEDETNSEMAARPMFEGSGWVRADGVAVILQTGQVFAGPDHASEIVLQGAREGDWLDDFASLTEVTGCRGGWVEGLWTISEDPDRPSSPAAIPPSAVQADGRVRGWATGVCAIQETTCDGVFGNRP